MKSGAILLILLFFTSVTCPSLETHHLVALRPADNERRFAEPPIIKINTQTCNGWKRVDRKLVLDSLEYQGGSAFSDFVHGEILVKFKSTLYVEKIDNAAITSIDSVNELNRRFKVAEMEPVLQNLYKLTFQESIDVFSMIREYEANPDVEYAEPNYLSRICVAPNDANYTAQWAHKIMQSELAWNIEKGSTNVVIAIIDTGVDWNHPDLAANIWDNTDEIIDGKDNDGNGYVDDVRGYDFVDTTSPVWPGEDGRIRDNNPMDFHGHGTHCAGIAAAVTNNSIGIAGTSWNCKIMPVRAGYKGKDGGGWLEDDDVIAAVRYAADNGADVISMSYGGYYLSEAEKEAYDYAYNKGCVLVAAAGNDGLRQKRSYPAILDNVIAVAATDQNDKRAYFSNYGSWIDVSAPGVEIYSTLFDDTYYSWQGTSMATPFVAGLAGLVLSKNPNFTNEEVRNVLRSTADTPNSSDYIGLGRINVYKALQKNSIPIANLNSQLDDATIRGIVKINGTASGKNFQSYELYCGGGVYPTEWTQIVPKQYSPVENGILATWNTNLVETTYGIYSIKLVVYDTNNQTSEDRVVVWISQEPSPGYYETSEYLIGSVAVGVIFLESNGTIDPETENWTSTEESQVISEIKTALDWWTGQNSSANLTFKYDIHYKVPTSYEPINHNVTDCWLWIDNAMTYLGYIGNQWDQLYQYANDIRNRLKTDWAFILIIIDSSNDLDGLFEDQYYGLFSIGGPFYLLTYDCGALGISNMDLVVARRTGTIFWGTNEYNGETEWSGYLNEHDIEGSGCLMDNLNLSLSEGTKLQVGWLDSDSDGILDIVDTFPEVSLKQYLPDPTDKTTLQYSGTVTVTPYPNQNPQGTGRAVTINKIISVQFRVDSGSWMDATAKDGAFDNSVEDFDFTISELSLGEHTIEVRAINSVGNIGYDADTITVVAMRDIAVVNIKPSKTVVGQGHSLNINVTVKNHGHEAAIFNISVYANTSIIQTKTITLESGNFTYITFMWNTTGYGKGNYTLSAYAHPLPEEVNITDNSCVDGGVIVAMVGDITGPEGFPDGKVEMRDISLVAKLFGVNYPDPKYNPNCDLTGLIHGLPDGKIEMRDVSLVSSNFGKTDS